MLGYLFVIVSILSFSTVNITDKIVAGTSDRYVSLLIRYSSALVMGIGLIFVSRQGFAFPDWHHGIVLISTGVLAYVINLIMYRGLKHVNAGAFFTIGYLYLTFLFFINIGLFGTSELLSPVKTIFAFSFIGFTMYMMYDAGKGGGGDFLGYFLAFICAIGWTIGFGVDGFFIKNHITSPIMTIFLTYVGALLAATIGFICTRKHHGYEFLVSKKKLFAPLIGGVLLSIGTAGLLAAYVYLPINIVNTISISDILCTTILSIVFLGERPRKKEIVFIIGGFFILLGFVIVK